MGFFTLRKALLFDDSGEHSANKFFSASSKSFQYKDGQYLIKLNNPSVVKLRGFIWDTKYYQYNIGNPEPIQNNKTRSMKSALNAEDFNTLLESNVAKQLNLLGLKKNLSNLLTPMNIIIACVVVGVIYLAMTGQLQGLISGLQAPAG